MNIAIKENREYLQALGDLYWFLKTQTNIEAIAGLAKYSELGYDCPYSLSGMKIFCEVNKQNATVSRIEELIKEVERKLGVVNEVNNNPELLALIENP